MSAEALGFTLPTVPHAKNVLDGRSVYFADEAGAGAPVVIHGGFFDPVGEVRDSNLARALPTDEFRIIYIDDRSVGRSGKPHEKDAYAMPLRVADAVAVLDELGIERAHFIGTSWGGRLGFGSATHDTPAKPTSAATTRNQANAKFDRPLRWGPPQDSEIPPDPGTPQRDGSR